MSKVNVLVVDDAPFIRDLVRKCLRNAFPGMAIDDAVNGRKAMAMLGKLGLKAEAVSCGEDAVSRVAEGGIDIVLMDMQMPVMDGETATRALRSNPRHAQLPIIAMTANAMEADRQRCFAAGMNDHVAKPIEPAALWAALGRWIRPRAGLGIPAQASRLPARLAALSPPATGGTGSGAPLRACWCKRRARPPACPVRHHSATIPPSPTKR